MSLYGRKYLMYPYRLDLIGADHDWQILFTVGASDLVGFPLAKR